MAWLGNLRLQTKLLGMVGVMIVLLLVISFVSWRAMSSLDTEMTAMANDRMQTQSALIDLTNSVQRYRVNIHKHALAVDPERIAVYEQTMTELEAEVEQAFERWQSVDADNSGAALREQFSTAWTDYLAGMKTDFIPLSRTGDREAVNEYLETTAVPLADAVNKAITDTQAQNDAGSQQAAENAANTFESGQFMLIAVAGIAIVAGLGLGILLTRPIVRGARAVSQSVERLVSDDLAQLEQAFARLADGDLTASYAVNAREVDVRGRDEIGALAGAYNQMVGSFERLGDGFGRTISELNRIVADVRASATVVTDTSNQTLEMTEQIASATMEVTGTIQDVAQGSAQQAEQVANVSHAFDQMNQTVDAVARGASEQGKTLQRAVELTQAIAEQNRAVAESAEAGLRDAQTNAEQARSGNQTVQRTAAAMVEVRGRVDVAAAKVAEMGERSKQIGEIVGTITDLTEQTNLLALNAAIEAARAGEAGKGFAVVAEEVRKLAERSSASTQEIAQLVQAVQLSVDEAVAAMADGAKGVEAVTAETDAVKVAFEGILVAAQALETRTREIAKSAEATMDRSRELQSRMEDTSAIAEENAAAAAEMAQTAVQVRSGMQGVSAVTEQNAAAAEEVSAATEETATQLEEVTASAQHLQELALSLQDVVARFRLRREGDNLPARGDRGQRVGESRPAGRTASEPKPVAPRAEPSRELVASGNASRNGRRTP